MLPVHENSNPTKGLQSTEFFDPISALQKEIEQREIIDQQLREAEERYRIIFEQAMDAIVLMDPCSATFLQFNSQTCRQLGYTPEEFGHMTIFDIDVQQSRLQLTNRIEHLLAHGPERFETIHKTKSGELRNVIVSARPILISGK